MTFYEAMQEVLRQPRYSHLNNSGENSVTTLIDNLWDVIDMLLNRILPDVGFSPMSGAVHSASTVSTVFGVVGILLLVTACFVIIRTILKARRQKDAVLDEIFADIQDQTADGLIALSDAAADRRQAVRYRYAACILQLNTSGVIDIKPSDTSSIILAQLTNTAPDVQPHFKHITDIFHYAWFGKKDIGDDVYSNFAAVAGKILSGDEV